ncbi:hypothetical protein PUN28_016127 [Cardiocondyla obscurior]|uniref:Uncharacterized protein n=1 Tax=Cardiocondyla obscurior TaxID=286306 RepID=A0AAW2EWD5_9HYME
MSRNIGHRGLRGNAAYYTSPLSAAERKREREGSHIRQPPSPPINAIPAFQRTADNYMSHAKKPRVLISQATDENKEFNFLKHRCRKKKKKINNDGAKGRRISPSPHPHKKKKKKLEQLVSLTCSISNNTSTLTRDPLSYRLRLLDHPGFTHHFVRKMKYVYKVQKKLMYNFLVLLLMHKFFFLI